MSSTSGSGPVPGRDPEPGSGPADTTSAGQPVGPPAGPTADGRDGGRTGSGTVRSDEHRIKPAKTSAAAALALAFGVAAVVSVVSVVLSPFALILGLVAVVLGVLGMKAAKKVGVTGRGVALAGLVLGALAFLLAVAAAIGVTTFLNDRTAVERLEQRLEALREDLPTDVEVPEP